MLSLFADAFAIGAGLLCIMIVATLLAMLGDWWLNR